MPRAARRCAGNVNKSVESSSALPLAGSAPIRARSRVVLPAPLRPIRPHISPSSSASEALRTTGTAPMSTLRPDTLSMNNLSGRNTDWHGTADQGLHHRVGECLRRRPIRDHGAIMERKHALGKARDDLHIVLDE